MSASLVGSEMCIRDSTSAACSCGVEFFARTCGQVYNTYSSTLCVTAAGGSPQSGPSGTRRPRFSIPDI
eukprot:10338760-Alexandrium_andersonii.AAC.1